jgi:pimeloyl-ACP methyl ester carboxylesterase
LPRLLAGLRQRGQTDIVTVLQHLQIQRADYWGYSMGGRIGFALAQFAPGCVCRLIIGGAAADGRSRIGDGFRKAMKAGGAAAIPGLWGTHHCHRPSKPGRLQTMCKHWMRAVPIVWAP